MTIRVTKAEGVQKIRGLIGAGHPKSLLLRTRFGIHTFGLSFPIDVVVLDKNNSVVIVKSSLKANGIFLWNPSYNQILELPEGTIEKKKIRIGETITFSFL